MRTCAKGAETIPDGAGRALDVLAVPAEEFQLCLRHVGQQLPQFPVSEIQQLLLLAAAPDDHTEIARFMCDPAHRQPPAQQGELGRRKRAAILQVGDEGRDVELAFIGMGERNQHADNAALARFLDQLAPVLLDPLAGFGCAKPAPVLVDRSNAKPVNTLRSNEQGLAYARSRSRTGSGCRDGHTARRSRWALRDR